MFQIMLRVKLVIGDGSMAPFYCWYVPGQRELQEDREIFLYCFTRNTSGHANISSLNAG